MTAYLLALAVVTAWGARIEYRARHPRRQKTEVGG